MDQPIDADLGHPGEHVDHRQLDAQQPDHGCRDRLPPAGAARPASPGPPGPGVERPHPVQREEHHQGGGQRHPVVVVEVEGAVDQLDPGEEHGVDRHAPPVAPAEGDAQRRQPHDGEVQVHPSARPRSHPTEPGVGEVERRVDEQLVDPSVGGVAQCAQQGDRPEGDPEHRSRGGADRGGGTVDPATVRLHPGGGAGRRHPLSPSVSLKPTVMSSSDATSASKVRRSSTRAS